MRFTRKYLEFLLQICLFWPQILGVSPPDRDNSTLKKNGYKMGPLLPFPIRVDFYDSLKKGLFRPFYPKLRELRWPDIYRTRIAHSEFILSMTDFLEYWQTNTKSLLVPLTTSLWLDLLHSPLLQSNNINRVIITDQSPIIVLYACLRHSIRTLDYDWVTKAPNKN